MGTTTILVVDDERKIRDLVRSYLELQGYSILVADSGERTLESYIGSETAIMRLTRPGQGPIGGKKAGHAFKIGGRAKARRRVRFPSASATADRVPCLRRETTA